MAAGRVPPSACSTSQSRVSVRSGIAERSTTARRLRPISRWISAVRPDGLPWFTSRPERVWVARGSMEYSAVSQPSPESFLKGGTRLSTLAATRTGVSPISIRAEPSANLRTPVSMRIGRRASTARPPGRIWGSLGFMAALYPHRAIRSFPSRRKNFSAPLIRCALALRRSYEAAFEPAVAPEIFSTETKEEWKREDPCDSCSVDSSVRRTGLGSRPGVQPPRGAGHHRDAQGGWHRFLHVQQL